MLKKTITYNDLDGNPITEDFYFNLSQAELVEMEVSEKDGLAETMQKLVEEQDGAKIIEHFKKIILMSYGQRGADGRQFIKNEELRTYFSQIGAYSVLFMELALDGKAGADFINGILPAGFNADVEAAVAKAQTSSPGFAKIYVPEEEAPKVEEPTDEFSNMSREDLVKYMRSQASAIVPEVTETQITQAE